MENKESKQANNGTITFTAGGAVKASKFTVTVPVDKMADVEKRLQALESVTIALS